MKICVPNFTIRKLTADDNECYFRWFEFWHHGQRPERYHCEEIAVVELDGIFYSGIMVQRIPNSVCCIFTSICRNPFAENKDLSSEAVDFLIKQLPSLAKKLGYTYFVSLVGEESAKARYRKNGVKEYPTPLTMFYGDT